MTSISGFVRGVSTRARGDAAEKAARSWLRERSFEIVATNFRAKPGEIDLIAMEEGCLCFVEIKARSNPAFGSPLEAVPKSKQRKIARAASAYLLASGWDGPCRFDVLGIERAGGSWRFDLVRDAFRIEPAQRRAGR